MSASSRPGVGRWLRIGGWAAIASGVAGLAGLVSVIPWPELFAIDAVPGNALVFEPGLKPVLIGHYIILSAGGALGFLAAVLLARGLRGRRVAGVAALAVAVASLALGIAAGARAMDLTIHDGRSTVDVENLVWLGGGVLLAGVLVLTLALRRRASKVFFFLGVSAPVLVTAALVAFMMFGPELYPEIWGVTFPPPSDYLLALWFIALGRLMRAESAGDIAETPV